MGPYHEDKATEGCGAMDVEGRGSGRFLHCEHYIHRAPHRCWPPRLQLTHQYIHKVLAVGGGQGSVGQRWGSAPGQGAALDPPKLPFSPSTVAHLWLLLSSSSTAQPRRPTATW